MKKKIIFVSCIAIYLILFTICCLVFGKYNYKSTDDLKQHFCDDFNEQYDKKYASYDKFVLVGSYKKGYLIAEYNYKFYTISDTNNLSMVLTIDNIDITTFNNTTFYFYSKGKITSGLENIYNKQLISKDELLEIKEYINNFSENNYIVTEYIIE